MSAKADMSAEEAVHLQEFFDLGSNDTVRQRRPRIGAAQKTTRDHRHGCCVVIRHGGVSRRQDDWSRAGPA